MAVKPDKRRVLIVDDEADFLKLLEQILEREGYEVCRASSGNEAFRELSPDKFDLVITDCKMADGDGLDLLNRIRTSAPIASMPVLVVSRVLNPQQFETFAVQQPVDILAKPFKKEKLFEKIRALLAAPS